MGRRVSRAISNGIRPSVAARIARTCAAGPGRDLPHRARCSAGDGARRGTLRGRRRALPGASSTATGTVPSRCASVSDVSPGFDPWTVPRSRDSSLAQAVSLYDLRPNPPARRAKGRMAPQVRGSLFLDYVRMLKARRDVDWRQHLAPADLSYLEQRIGLEDWYPMAAFERLGIVILDVIARGDLGAVRAWGKRTVLPLSELHGGLLVKDDPRESLMRFHVLRRTFFDFEAANVTRLDDSEVRMRIAYGMSPTAEEAASYQTMGFFDGLVELAGGEEVRARFEEQAWHGAKATTLVVSWRQPTRPSRRDSKSQ